MSELRIDAVTIDGETVNKGPATLVRTTRGAGLGDWELIGQAMCARLPEAGVLVMDGPHGRFVGCGNEVSGVPFAFHYARAGDVEGDDPDAI